jgi:hypothetical protein
VLCYLTPQKLKLCLKICTYIYIRTEIIYLYVLNPCNAYLFLIFRPASDASSSGSASDSEDGGLQVTQNDLGGLTSTQNLIDTPQSTDGEGAPIKSSGQRIKISSMKMINTGLIQPGINHLYHLNVQIL